jgi:Mo-dependent nitrogenase C-terminus
MDVTEYTVKDLFISSVILRQRITSRRIRKFSKNWNLLNNMRQWIDRIEIQSNVCAHRICRLIPAQCPFARTVKLFDRTLFIIPPLCKLNPFYDEFVALRFRALSYLADDCGEDISCYC